MRERLTADDLFSYILLLRPGEKRIILLVEGDSDYVALRSHLSKAEINAIPGYGKGIIEPAMSRVNQYDIPNVAALLDRDFGELLPALQRHEPNVFYTDHYDLDATIFAASDLCDRVGHNFGDPDQVSSLIADLECPLVGASVNLALALGVLRYISVRDGFNLRLRDFPLGEVVRDDCRGIDIDALTTIAVKRSAEPTKRPRDIVVQIQAEMAKISDPLAYCSGHDLARALSVILRKRGGAAVRPEIIERSMRAAFGCSEMRDTSMYSNLALWAQQRGKSFWSCDSHR